MTATNRQLRDALADALHSVSGVHVYRVPPDNIQSPAVIVGGFDWEADTFVEGRKVNVNLWVATSRRNAAFIDALDHLCDPDDGVAEALNDDPTLGGAVDSVRVVSVGDYRDLEIAGTGYYAATIRCEVFC
jgi:hypothetical protein